MPETGVPQKDDVARALIAQHIDECRKRYDLLIESLRDLARSQKDLQKEMQDHIDSLEGVMWKIMWGGIAGLAAIIGILLELRHSV